MSGNKKSTWAATLVFLAVFDTFVFMPSAPAQVAAPGHAYYRDPQGGIQDLATPQQNATLNSVSVSANTSTVIYTPTNTTPYPRVLRLVPETTSGTANSSCSMNDAGGTATALSTSIPNGYVFSGFEPTPGAVVSVYCTTAGYVSVEVGY